MLVITLRVGESFLAGKLFELHYRDFDLSRLTFELEVNERSPFTVVDARGNATVDMAYPGEPGRFVVAGGCRVKVLDCEIEIERFRESGVKLGISAPRSVKISRPAKHGTSLRSA